MAMNDQDLLETAVKHVVRQIKDRLEKGLPLPDDVTVAKDTHVPSRTARKPRVPRFRELTGDMPVREQRSVSRSRSPAPASRLPQIDRNQPLKPLSIPIHRTTPKISAQEEPDVKEVIRLPRIPGIPLRADAEESPRRPKEAKQYHQIQQPIMHMPAEPHRKQAASPQPAPKKQHATTEPKLAQLIAHLSTTTSETPLQPSPAPVMFGNPPSPTPDVEDKRPYTPISSNASDDEASEAESNASDVNWGVTPQTVETAPSEAHAAAAITEPSWFAAT